MCSVENQNSGTEYNKDNDCQTYDDCEKGIE
jgi:hypothetical protein